MKTANGERRYGNWGGCPDGYAEDTTHCIKEVFPSDRGALHHQCGNKRGFGKDGLYCKRHAIENPAEGECNDVTMYYVKTKFGSGVAIIPVTAASFTEKTVQVASIDFHGEREVNRENRVTDYGCYFETREEAVAFQKARQKNIIARAEANIAEAREILKNLEQ